MGSKTCAGPGEGKRLPGDEIRGWGLEIRGQG